LTRVLCASAIGSPFRHWRAGLLPHPRASAGPLKAVLHDVELLR
jgi:hypothetical protein